MAETTTRSSGAGAAATATASAFSSSTTLSPITQIAQDHIFSILLLLPMDSIISFSMTCSRFRSLALSESLWEAVCRRDWGPAAVDALKSSAEATNRQQQLSWMRLYKQVRQLDSVSCHRLSDPDVGMVLPKARASHSLNFVSDCLVLFGGGCEGGRHIDDTWVAYIGNDFRRTLRWEKIASGIPTGRFGHTCIVVGSHLVLFGGINDAGIRHNDTWIGEVVLHRAPGFAVSWRLLELSSAPPPPRGAHAGCCIGNNSMLIHGGIGPSGHRLGDTWVLDLSENLRLGTWREVVMTNPSPPPRSGHTLTCIAGNRTVLFGGRGLSYDVLNDLWLFEFSGKCPNWVQIVYDSQTIPGGISLPRVGHSATLILGGRVLIYGGEDSERRRKDDFWVVDIGAITPVSPVMNIWKRLNAKGYKPEPRSFHGACTDRSGRLLFVLGGMVDGVVQPAEPGGLRFDAELFLAELVIFKCNTEE